MPRELRPIARLTQADVAARAGVSRATVSAVMNRTRFVSPEVEQRVRAAMHALAYEPNALARGLKFRRTYTLGLLVPNIHSPFWPAVVQGIEDCARRRHYNVLFYSTGESSAEELTGLGLFVGRQVDGMLVAPAGQENATYLARLDSSSMPIVLLDRRLDGAPLSSVTVDNTGGAYGAVRHLLESGRRRVAVITIPETISTGRDRVLGYKAALEDAGLPVDRALIRTTPFTAEGSYAQTRALFQAPDPPDAIFGTNHLAVIGALHALKALDRRVPADVAIVGFDEHPWAALLDPPLTTVAQPMYDLGVQAADLLIDRIERDGLADADPAAPATPARQIVLPTRLIHRGSCGCASPGLSAATIEES
jgi:LacI family transcriptional regulator